MKYPKKKGNLSMKKMKLLTRKFISENIKINATVSSYPIRKVAPTVTRKNALK